MAYTRAFVEALQDEILLQRDKNHIACDDLAALKMERTHLQDVIAKKESTIAQQQAEIGRERTRAEAAEQKLAALQERTRWHLDPVDLPDKERVVIVLLDDGQIKDDLICFNGTWLSNDHVIGWREADFPTLPVPPEAA